MPPYAFIAALSIRRRVLDPDGARIGVSHLNVGSACTQLGRADEGEPHLREALTIWRKAYADIPQHRDTLAAAKWLAGCLLVRARAGEDAAPRRADARRLCDEFGLDFAEQELFAERTPYAPGGENV